MWDELACLKWTFTALLFPPNFLCSHKKSATNRILLHHQSSFLLQIVLIFSLWYWGLFSKLIMDNGLTKIVCQLFVLLHSATIAQLINRQSFGLTFCPLMFCFNRIFFQARFHFIIRISLYSVNNVHLIFCFKNYIFKHILIL